jgi:hypothetical protein
VLPCGDGQEVPETCTLITTLLDHHAVDAEQIRGAYQSRWPASETTFGEDKTTITGAGDRTSGPVLRPAPRGWSSAVLGLDDCHPAGPRQRRRVPGHRRRGRAGRCGGARKAARSPPTRCPSPLPGTTRSAR